MPKVQIFYWILNILFIEKSIKSQNANENAWIQFLEPKLNENHSLWKKLTFQNDKNCQNARLISKWI
jgi:hypothetical protein